MKKLVFAIALFIGAALTGLAQDVSETVKTNTKVTLTATADGTLPITFTWFKNNVELTTGTAIVFEKIQTTDAGVYRVVASNEAGSATSNNATLIVIVPVGPSNVKIIVTKG